MKLWQRRSIAASLFCLLLIIGCNHPVEQSTQKQSVIDPLPSWNEGPAKRSILDFVGRVTNRRRYRLRALGRSHRNFR